MTIHRPDRPNAPARVRKSTLRPDRWAWRCLDKPTHHENGYPSWEDAFAAMEKHRRMEHTYVLDERVPRFTEDDVEIVDRSRAMVEMNGFGT